MPIKNKREGDVLSLSIVNKNGKLFGIVNIVDIILLVSFLAFTVLLFIGYKSLVKHNIKKEVWTDVDVEFQDVVPELARVIRKGDVAKDMSGNIHGKLDAILNVRPTNLIALIGNDPARVAPHPFKKDILVRLSLKCEEKNGILYYEDAFVK